jgi:peptidyl-prolyl cis-trans isomerase C
LSVLLFALCAAPSGCKKGGAAGAAPLVAKVGDTPITIDDVQNRLSNQSPFARKRFAAPEKKKELVEDMIRFELLAREAQRRGYDRDPEVARAMKQQMIAKLLEHEFESKMKPENVPDSDVEKYYREHPAEFSKKAEVRATEIFVADKALADRVFAEASASRGAAGADLHAFYDLVTRYSEDKASKDRGGDLSFFDRDSTSHPKPLVDAAFRLSEVGEVSPPVQLENGWAILMLVEKRPGFDRPLTEVKHDIQLKLFQDVRAKAFEAFVADLAKQTKVERYDDELAKINVDVAPANSGARRSADAAPKGSSEAQGLTAR